MAKRKHEGQDTYYRAYDDIWLHRCSVCWPEVTKVDNGFVPLTQEYPHKDDCPLKGKF